MNRELLSPRELRRHILASGGMVASGVALAEVGVKYDSLLIQLAGLDVGISNLVHITEAFDRREKRRPPRFFALHKQLREAPKKAA